MTVKETHASWVFIAGERAYKVKKPVTLDFLDYSTLARRHAACREEVRVNRKLAPDIYLGVRAIIDCGRAFRLVGDGDPGAVEYAVEMRRFREADTLAGMVDADSLTRASIAAVAGRLADFHRAAPVVAGGAPGQVLDAWQTNISEIRRMAHPCDWDLDVAAGFGEAFVNAHKPELAERERLGFVRDGHGDLRCEHVLVTPTVRVVDRIEFDRKLRCVDIACDLAFLAMDLEAHGQRWAVDELYDAYRNAGLSPGSEALRAFYAAHRALVRAKVALIAAGEHDGDARVRLAAEAQGLWELSERLCWRARGPVAIVVCGPAASGKSTLAAELSRRSGMPVISSDVVRKAAAGLTATERARPEHYGEQFTRATYERLDEEARLALAREGGVIVDATCRSRAERSRLLNHLRRASPVLLVVRCDVPLEVALERARRRLDDARRVSDATPEVVAEQFRAFEALDEIPKSCVLALDTEGALDAQVSEVTRRVDLRLTSP